MMRDIIEEKINKKRLNTKQIAIKKIKTKLNTKNKWKDVFIFCKEKRERKEEEEEKSQPECNHYSSDHTCDTTAKNTMISF